MAVKRVQKKKMNIDVFLRVNLKRKILRKTYGPMRELDGYF